MRNAQRKDESSAGRYAVPNAPSSASQVSGAGPGAPVGREHLPFSYHLVWGSSLALFAVGLVMVFSTSSVAALFQGDDSLKYVEKQALIGAFGLVALVALSRIPYQRLRPWILGAFILSVVLLLLVHVPYVGRSAKGAARWIDLGPLPLQPSEVAKLVIVGVAASLLATQRALKGGAGRLLLPLGPIVLGVCALVLAERDLGTALLIAGVTMGLLWVADLSGWQWTFIALVGSSVGALFILITPFRRERFLAFLHPFATPLDGGFQIVQSLLAFGSGGLTGVGPGRSIQKFNYLPEARTDMIFAILGEEFGLLGVALVLSLFALFVAAGWRIAMRCRDPFGKYLAAGCTLLVGGQALVNAGGVLGALPLTGVPLPFISYGRTNLLIMLAAVGIILSVARHGPTEPEDLAAPILEESPNVSHIDRRRRHRRSRGAGVGAR